MARTANRFLQSENKEIRRTPFFQAGNYLRLSVDSDYTGSDSLENQRKLAKEYVDRFSDIKIIKEYIDDGKTGTNFERPSFVRMIADIKQGKINCVIVKDLSRFGREYIESGNYIEKVFPFLGIRFISIVDRYDSDDPECGRELLLISLKNLMHEMYARDISKKVGSTFQMKHEKGEFYRSSIIPYGYKMSPNNENYCLDDPAANIVKEIFLKYAQGISRYAICHWLYEHRVLTPAQYMKTGHIYQRDGEEINVWQSSTIERMLKNPVYKGTIIRHKTIQSFFENKKAEAVPEEEQIMIVDNHPPIVSEEIFTAVQEILRRRRVEYKEYRKTSDSKREDVLFDFNVFQGKIFCGSCKTGMTRSVNYRTVDGELERFKVFKCKTHIKLPQYCDSRGIDENELCEILYKMIQKQLSLIKGVRKLMKNDIYSFFEEKIRNIEKEKQRLQNNQIISEQDYIQRYTAYTAGLLLAEDFQTFRMDYLKRIQAVKKQEQELQHQEKRIKKNRMNLKKLFDQWLLFDNEKRLTKEMIEVCVERIEVFKDNRLEIILRYQDCFKMLENWAREVR